MTLQYNQSEDTGVNDYSTCNVEIIVENSIERFINVRGKTKKVEKRKKRRTVPKGTLRIIRASNLLK